MTLEFNVTKWPLNDPAVRQAISAGINRSALGIKGESGYEAPATSLSGLILPSQAGYLGSQYKNDIKSTSQPKTVKSILTKAGLQEEQAGLLREERQGDQVLASRTRSPTPTTTPTSSSSLRN